MKRIYSLSTLLVPLLLLSCMPVTPQPQNEATTVPTLASPLIVSPLIASSTTTSTAILPSEDGYTGMQEVDTLITALLEQDVATITSHIQLIEMACTIKEGLGGPPKCEEGQEEGTVVEVFPIMATHGFYLTPDSVNDLRLNLAELYAVYVVPAETNPGGDWPIGDYALVFENGDPVPNFVTIFITGSKVVRIGSNFVESAQEALPASVQLLYRAEGMWK